MKNTFDFFRYGRNIIVNHTLRGRLVHQMIISFAPVGGFHDRDQVIFGRVVITRAGAQLWPEFLFSVPKYRDKTMTDVADLSEFRTISSNTRGNV